MKQIYLLLAMFIALSASASERKIRTVGLSEVVCAEGHAPMLPWHVLVTYSDKTEEWRQVRWSVSQSPAEEALAGKRSGEVYDVQGWLIGDQSTDNGYPVTATVRVVDASEATQAPHLVAEPLPLSAVKLAGDNRLTQNRDRDIRELLSLDISQQLYNYRDTYGLPTEGYTESDGWDSPTTKLKGHGTGHYLSALAMAYASCHDAALRDSLLARIYIMVSEMRACQERTFVWSDSLGRYFEARDLAPEEELKEMLGTWEAMDQYKQHPERYGYGYLNAIPAQHALLIEMYRAYNNEEWVWAPYYTIHKQLAGLIDIALCVDNEEIRSLALLIAKDMGLWVWNRLAHRTYVKTDGTKAERMERPGNRYEMWNMYIAGEVGGMAESLARLSEMTSEPEAKARLLEAATFFDAPAFFEPLSRGVDEIRTRHANQHIPMVTGTLRAYRSNGDVARYEVARNFWHLTMGRYAYAMGGVGNGEMFRQPYSQALSMNTNIMSDHRRDMYPNPDINETCCAYNLAKLTKDLNCFTPDDASLMDYYERVLTNQIVGSLSPDTWAVTYQYAVGMNATKPFGNETPQASCCGGTGVENHVKYQEAAYFANDTCLWVALYLPSEARFRGMTIAQQCTWPAEAVRIEMQGAGEFALKLRVPYWATAGFTVRLNGKVLCTQPSPSSYFLVPRREWRTGDVVEIAMPFAPHISFLPDKMDLAATGRNETRTPFDPQWLGALMLGPMVMATPDVSSWDEADFRLSSALSEITNLGVTGTDGTGGPLYGLSLAGRRFAPDYFVGGPATHYLRLHVASSAKRKTSKKADRSALDQAIALGQERLSMPESWAPHGLQRLSAQLDSALLVSQKPAKQLTQDEINRSLASLNMAINTMRPSNLAEPEDLAELLPMLSSAKNIRNKTTALREAIDYADMVVQYVNDGSGTHDLIAKATKRLREALSDIAVSASAEQ